MSIYLEKAKELRAITEIHYNCAQAVIVPFAKDAGMTDEAAYNVAANFGAGMKMASICGAITGGLMVLGLFGLDDARTIASYYHIITMRFFLIARFMINSKKVTTIKIPLMIVL